MEELFKKQRSVGVKMLWTKGIASSLMVGLIGLALVASIRGRWLDAVFYIAWYLVCLNEASVLMRYWGRRYEEVQKEIDEELARRSPMSWEDRMAEAVERTKQGRKGEGHN